MTYVYTKTLFRPDLERKTSKKAVKIGMASVAVVAIAAAAFVMTAPKSKPAALATQPAIIKIPAQDIQTKATPSFQATELYRKADNAIRDVQIDNAHYGHSLKVAMNSDRNPIRSFFIAADRKFTLMGVLVGLSFLFTLYSFGFIKSRGGDDLANY